MIRPDYVIQRSTAIYINWFPTRSAGFQSFVLFRCHKLYNKGLWFEKSELTFFLKDEFGDSSIIEPLDYQEKITIETITLDHLISEINSSVKLIKLEAEGAEPEILNGLTKYLKNVEYLTIDVGYERGVNSESTLAPCINYLVSRNYELIDFNPIKMSILLKNKKFESFK